MRLLIVLAAVAVCVMGAAKKTTTVTTASFCTDFKEYGSEYFSDYEDRYYKLPLINTGNHCKSQHLGNWRPTYKVTAKTSECPSGALFWEERGTCYKEGAGDKNFRDAETECNSMNGHLFVPNDLKEMRWVTTRAYQHGGWHWLGFFCSTDNSHEVRDTRTVTRENTVLISQGLPGARGHQPLHHHGNACWMHQSERADKSWWIRFHHQNCTEGHKYVCEIPISA